MLAKTLLAAAMAIVIWFIADAFGLEPRVMDGWLLFFIEYTGLTVVNLKRDRGV